MKKKNYIIIILSIIATFNAAYLTYVAYSSSSSSVCDISETFSCSSVLNLPETQFFGFPFPAVALVVYPIIFLIGLWALKKKRNNFKILAILSGGGIIFNSYFIYQEYLIGTFCPLCAICSVIIITIFILSISSIKNNLWE